LGQKEVSIPTFPVDGSKLGAVKERVTAARRLDKMLLANRLVEVQEGPVRLDRGDVVLTFCWCNILKFLHHVEISCCCIW
jgi:hypothetical protein